MPLTGPLPGTKLSSGEEAMVPTLFTIWAQPCEFMKYSPCFQVKPKFRNLPCVLTWAMRDSPNTRFYSDTDYNTFDPHSNKMNFLLNTVNTFYSISMWFSLFHQDYYWTYISKKLENLSNLLFSSKCMSFIGQYKTWAPKFHLRFLKLRIYDYFEIISFNLLKASLWMLWNMVTESATTAWLTPPGKHRLPHVTGGALRTALLQHQGGYPSR